MPRRTNPFQKLSTSIMAVFYEPEYEVIESVLVSTPKTGVVRELDILITHRRDVDNKFLVECRNYGRAQDVRWIDELAGKAQALKLKKVIAVSSSGFTKPAMVEAAARNIATLHLREAEEQDWRKCKFGLETFGLNVIFDPVVTGVDFMADPSFTGPFPQNIRYDDMILVNTKEKTKIRLKDWVVGFQKDPKVAEKLRKLDENDAINHYKYDIPCDPGIGIVVESTNQFIPLAKVIFSIDSTCADYSVPLKHFQVGDEIIHLGDSMILGRETRLVLREYKGTLKVMIEQELRRNEKHKE